MRVRLHTSYAPVSDSIRSAMSKPSVIARLSEKPLLYAVPDELKAAAAPAA